MIDPTIHLNGVNMANLTGKPTLMHVTATSGLKLRAAPAGDVLRTLAFEEQVTAFLDSVVTSPDVTWVLVRDKDGTVGWTAQAYLAPLTEPPTPEPPTPEPDTDSVTLSRQQYNDLATASATIARVLNEIKPQ